MPLVFILQAYRGHCRPWNLARVCCLQWHRFRESVLRQRFVWNKVNHRSFVRMNGPAASLPSGRGVDEAHGTLTQEVARQLGVLLLECLRFNPPVLMMFLDLLFSCEHLCFLCVSHCDYGRLYLVRLPSVALFWHFSITLQIQNLLSISLNFECTDCILVCRY